MGTPGALVVGLSLFLLPWDALSDALLRPEVGVRLACAGAQLLALGATWARRPHRTHGTPASRRLSVATTLALLLGASHNVAEACASALARQTVTAAWVANLSLCGASWGLAWLAACGVDHQLRAALAGPPESPGDAARAARVARWPPCVVALLIAPLSLCVTESAPRMNPLGNTASDGGHTLQRSFSTDYGPRGLALALPRTQPLLLAVAPSYLLWVSEARAVPVSEHDVFPATTYVLMARGARVSDFAAMADVAIGHGAQEVEWVLPCTSCAPRGGPFMAAAPHPTGRCVGGGPADHCAPTPISDGTPRRYADPSGAGYRAPCTRRAYDLVDALSGPVTRAPVRARAVRRAADARPGMPWTDQLGPLADLNMWDIDARGMHVLLQRWSPSHPAEASWALVLHDLLVGLTLGLALFLCALFLDALHAQHLCNAWGSRRLRPGHQTVTGPVFPAFMPHRRATHAFTQGSPYRSSSTLATASFVTVMHVAMGRLRATLSLLLALMLGICAALWALT